MVSGDFYFLPTKISINHSLFILHVYVHGIVEIKMAKMVRQTKFAITLIHVIGIMVIIMVCAEYITKCGFMVHH